jgi:hypothetical protein
MRDRAIWKQGLAIKDSQIVKLPRNARILSAQIQHEKLCLWYLFDVEESTRPQLREIVIYGTGHDIAARDSLEHIATVQIEGGNLVFHVFEADR